MCLWCMGEKVIDKLLRQLDTMEKSQEAEAKKFFGGMFTRMGQNG